MVNLPAKHVVNDTGHTADHNTIVDALTALTLGVGGPTSVTRARIRLAADNANSMANAAWTAVVMDTMDVDSDGLWVQATKSRLLIQQAGTYVLEGQLVWNANVTGFRDAAIWKNGVGTGSILGETVVAANPTAANLTIQNVETGPVQLNAGDYVELGGYQNSGGALLLRQNNNLGSWLGLRRVDAGNVAYGTGGSQLLGTASRVAAADGGLYTTTSTTFVDMDAANLIVSFTAPASGRVLVRLSANIAINPTTTANAVWNLRDANGDVAGTARLISQNIAAMETASILVSGLTAGQVYTWKWGWRVTGAVTATINSGPSYGPALMEVYDATVGTPNNSFPQNGITQPFLAVKSFNPGTASVYTAPNTATVQAADATNAAVTFIAPASGQVLVTLSAYFDISVAVGGNQYVFAVIESGSVVAGSQEIIWRDTTNAGSRTSTEFLITGLTPGSSHTYLFAYGLAVSGATNPSFRVLAGGTAGALIMTVQDAVLSPNMTQQSPNPFLLALTKYAPATRQALFTASATSVAIDTTNLKVTFIAPASGQVRVVLSGTAYANFTASGQYFWCLRDGSGEIATTRQGIISSGGADSGSLNTVRTSSVYVVSGLTPGQQYTWYWSHLINNGNNGYLISSNGNDGNEGPAVMEVWDGTAGQGTVQTPPGLTTLGRFYGYKTSSTALASNTWTVIPIDTVIDDPLGKWVAANNAWTAPATGTYLVTASVNFGASASDRYFVGLAINGTRVPGRSEVKVDATNGNELVYTRQVRLNAGDTVALMAISTTAGVNVQGAAGANESNTSLEIIQLLDTGHAPSAASASQVIGARVWKSTSADLAAANTKYAINWDTVDKDAGGFWNSTANTSRLTVPAGAGGTYRVKVQATAALPNGGNMQVGIFRNGNTQEIATVLGSSNAAGAGAWVSTACDRIIDLSPGDYVEGFVSVSSVAQSPDLIGGDSGALTFMEIERVNSIALTDPTAQLGDMVVRGSGGALSRLPVGDTNGKQLTVNSAAPLGVDYEFPALRYAQSVGDGTGDKNTTSTTTFVALAGLASIAVAALAGDVIDLQFTASAYSPAAGQADFVFAIAGTTKTDIIQRSTAAALNSPQPVTMRRLYTVQAADISAGTVTVAVYWRSPNGNASVANGAVTGGTIVPVLTAVNIG